MAERRRSEERPVRSPSYPAINLRAAAERAQVALDEIGDHVAPRAVFLETWGFKSMSGKASTVYSAMKKYGLVSEERGPGRRARLTPLAVGVVEGRAEALRTAALEPKIHRYLWDTYGRALPGRALLRSDLIGRQRFTESGFEELIREWSETLDYAFGDSGGPSVRRPEPGLPALGSCNVLDPPGLAVAMPGGGRVVAWGPFTEAEWHEVMDALERNEAVLVPARTGSKR